MNPRDSVFFLPLPQTQLSFSLESKYMTNDNRLSFDGGALDFLVARILSFLITFLTLGIAYPWAICIMESWKAEHTLFNGRRFKFVGSGFGLWGNWIKWWFFCFITLGIYGFWLVPSINRWTAQNTILE